MCFSDINDSVSPFNGLVIEFLEYVVYYEAYKELGRINQNELGNKLISLRVQSNSTQKEIAEKLIITPQTISKWELGVSSPSIEMLIQLADLYNVSVDEMIR